MSREDKNIPQAGTESTETGNPQYKIIFILALVHFTGDFYSSFFTPLLPAFVEKLGLSLAQAGLITGVVRFLSFIIQPVVGYMADQYESRKIMLTGLFLTFFIIPLSGIAPSWWLLIVILGIGSVGSSMYHPSTSGMIPLYAGRKTGLGISIFNTGGTFAFALGPIFITWYVSDFGLEAMPYTVGLGLLSFLFCLRFLPRPVSEKMSHLGFFGSMKEAMGKVYKTMILIWMVMVLRAVVSQAFMTFMPVYLSRQGHSLTSVGIITSLFTVAGTMSGLLAGYFADKTGFKILFVIAHIMMIPALLLYLHMPGNWVILGSFAAGFFSLASMPLGIAMAQKLAPKSRSMAASLMMGFAYGLGGSVSPLVGKCADIYGIEPTLFCLAFIPLISLLLILRFPSVK